MGNSSTHYTVHCHKHTWINVYDGYSRSQYDYYRNRSGNCWKCAQERNERARREAEERARRARRAEERRVSELKARLEREERARLKEEQAKREKEQERARIEWQRKRDEMERERVRMEKEALRKSNEEIKRKAEKLRREREAKKTRELYNGWKNSDVPNTIKNLGKRALGVSAAGQAITDAVDGIKTELKDSLKDNYALIEDEVKRYEGYGKEMSGMNDEFIAVFEEAFNDEKVDDHFDKHDFDEDAKEFNNAEDDDEKELYQESMDKETQKMKNRMDTLSKAIKSMRLKLSLMEQYYLNMQQDYEVFIEFIKDRKSDYKFMGDGIDLDLTRISEELKRQGMRDVFQGQTGKEYQQKSRIEVEYDMINVSKETKTVRSGNYAKEGAIIGGIGGAVLGGSLGGAIGGALIGGIIGFFCPKKKLTETKWVSTTVKGTVKVDVEKQVYNGSDHAKALEDIRDAMKPLIQRCIDDLERKKQSANAQLREIMYLLGNTQAMMKQADTFKENIDHLKDSLSSDKPLTQTQWNMLDKQWKETHQEVGRFVESIKLMKQKNIQ